MKAVIPCAKKKDNLFPFTESKPTALLPISGRPLIKHVIHDLQELGIEDIYIVTNYREDMIEDEFDEYTNVNLVHQEELDGTASAIEQCGFIDDDFFVVNGDVIVSRPDLKSLQSKHEEHDADATILGTDQKKPEKFGVLSITNDSVKALAEKPENAENPLVNTGIYVFSPKIFDAIDETDSEHITDAVRHLVENGDVRMEIIGDYWLDIDSPKKIWSADRIKREAMVRETSIHEEAEVHDDVHILGKAMIEKGAHIKPVTVIEGTTFIGKNSVIGPNTVLKDCTIGENSQVRSANLEEVFTFEEAIVDPNVFIETSVLAEDVDVLSGTAIRESFIGPRSFIDINNSMRGVKFVPDARTDLDEISK
jgi:NDP-sugar pyrophosphorylase family protein